MGVSDTPLPNTTSPHTDTYTQPPQPPPGPPTDTHTPPPHTPYPDPAQAQNQLGEPPPELPDCTHTPTPQPPPPQTQGTHTQASNPGGFADLHLLSHYGGSRDLLGSFYVPVLQRAVRYDRVAGYFASSAFVSAAAGVARFVAGGGVMRLLVGAQLTEDDRNALLGRTPLDDVLTERLLADIEGSADSDPESLEEALRRRRLEVVAWLVREQRLQIRVGLPCDDGGVPLTADRPETARYFHSKWGVLSDAAGGRIVFHGSINESARGWTENYETFDVHTSWGASWESHGQPRVEEFEQLWQGRAVGRWKSVPLPEAVERDLLKLLPDEEGWTPEARDPLEVPPEVCDPLEILPESPPEPPEPPTPAPALTELERQRLEAVRDAPLSCSGVGLVSAGVRPWAHQTAIARRIVESWPRSYLLADEVGLGKTIELGLALRELLLSGTISTALLLVPASVLKQWQEELSEKLLLDVPRLDLGKRKLCWANERSTPIPPGSADGWTSDELSRRANERSTPIPPGSNPWRAAPVLLASSHLARRRQHRNDLLDGDAWDLVFVDEIHHARRRGSKPTDTPNQLLATLIELKKHDMWRVLLAASATPMQLHTHDLWDILNLMGLPELWSSSAEKMEGYYQELLEAFPVRHWNFLQTMLAAQIDFAEPDAFVKESVQERLGWVGADRLLNFHTTGLDRFAAGEIPRSDRECWDEWLRANTPVRDRIFRTTRATLRAALPAAEGSPAALRSAATPQTTEGSAAEGSVSLSTSSAARAAAAGSPAAPRSGLAETTIPVRKVCDAFCDLGGNQALYDRIEDYIMRYYDVYLKEGKRNAPLGFIMTVYRRRLTSSFHAVKRSLERRLEALRDHRVALDALLDEDDEHALETSQSYETADLTADSGDLQVEIDELDAFVSDLANRPPDEPKMKRLHSLLRESFSAGHRTAVIFTQYTDTLDYIREQLRSTYAEGVLCYSGRGGERWNSKTQRWEPLPKEEVKELFRRGEGRILVGTDSMSEGLNLQTCARLFNFDLPWNFMRVEQRIGRVDRIGGRPAVHVTNFFYKGTVEEDIYTRIADRHDWFTHVVGNAQPVLASTEVLFEQAAMRRMSPADAADEFERTLGRLDAAPLQLQNLDSVPRHQEDLSPAMDLEGLKENLFAVGAVRERFREHPEIDGAWLLTLRSDRRAVTFDQSIYENTPGLSLLSWGSDPLEGLLEEVLAGR